MGSKQDLLWHSRCFNNAAVSAMNKKKEIKQMEKSYLQDLRNLAFYGHQIASSIVAGKNGFDSERFMKKKRAWYDTLGEAQLLVLLIDSFKFMPEL